eukprot:CAMPEP_0184755132 /NCGR_PEP_ID=MMETSP0315-20130426/44998_1 /TAXON_ID=101924 /ORGANISM="Rhodosorus marinus, Strain UTEX LB 2760" /LENGTH=82 /DNA_ID=CAMNT_0027234607 /DNA_START=906 /DNA_END=1150 /DNA_ORIENTATION=+
MSGVIVSCKRLSAPLKTKPPNKAGAAIARHLAYRTAIGTISADDLPARAEQAPGEKVNSSTATNNPSMRETYIFSTIIFEHS